MKKYAVAGIGLLIIFTFFYSQGKQPLERTNEVHEVEPSNTIIFPSQEHVMEKAQQVQLLLKAIKRPTAFPFETNEPSFSVSHATGNLLVRLEAEEMVLTIATQNPILNKMDYQEVAFKEQKGWFIEADEQSKMTIENEGLYYTVTSSTASVEELTNALNSLEETTVETHIKWKELKLPTAFPSDILEVGEVRYTKGQEETLTVTYVMKEEYTIAYTIHADDQERGNEAWETVQLESERTGFYSEIDNHFLWKENGYTYEITSYGRELSLDEFLFMTN